MRRAAACASRSAAPTSIASSISSFGTFGRGYARRLWLSPRPMHSSASLYVSGPGLITGTGRCSRRKGTAWCIVVEPMQITSAPSSMQARPASRSFGKTTSSLPPSRFSTSGGMLIERMETHLSASPYSARPLR